MHLIYQRKEMTLGKLIPYTTALEVAQNHLDWALTEDAVDKAIFELGAAEKTLSLFFQEEQRKDRMYRKKRKAKPKFGDLILNKLKQGKKVWEI